MTVQTRQFPFARPLLLNALYDVADQIGAKLISGDSTEGILQIKMPDACGVFRVVLSDTNPCVVTITAGSDASPKFGYEQEVWGVQFLFSRLEIILAGLQ